MNRSILSPCQTVTERKVAATTALAISSATAPANGLPLVTLQMPKLVGSMSNTMAQIHLTCLNRQVRLGGSTGQQVILQDRLQGHAYQPVRLLGGILAWGGPQIEHLAISKACLVDHGAIVRIGLGKASDCRRVPTLYIVRDEEQKQKCERELRVET